MGRRVVWIYGLIAILCLTSCSAGPDQTAKHWIEAFAKNDGATLSKLTCSADQTALQGAATIYSALGMVASSFIGGNNAQLGVDELRYVVTRNDGRFAEVSVQGRLRVTLLLISRTQDVNFPMPMSYEQGSWRYCPTS
jgi:hypothetical protein